MSAVTTPARPATAAAPTPAAAPATPAVRRHPLGFHELADKPEPEALAAYYAHKYYQQSIRTHRPSYSADELAWRQMKIGQKAAFATAHLTLAADATCRFLDIGAGEGHAMAWFAAQGWQVHGIDHSRHACATHHPALLPHLRTGDIDTALDAALAEGERFELILMDNVLEHLLQPADTLARVRELLAPGGVLLIEVPNDFSALQQHLLDQGHITRPFWVVAPDHVSYFNAAGLKALCASAGLDECGRMGDFPIDLALLNPRTNYVADPSAGPGVHRARVEAEMLLHRLSPEGTLALYQALGALGLGRAIVMACRRAGEPHPEPVA